MFRAKATAPINGEILDGARTRHHMWPRLTGREVELHTWRDGSSRLRGLGGLSLQLRQQMDFLCLPYALSAPAASTCLGVLPQPSAASGYSDAPSSSLPPAHSPAPLSLSVNSVAQSCLTLCDPMDCRTPGFSGLQQLPELAQTHVHRVSDSIQPSRPLLSPSLPASNLSQHQGLFQ